MEEFIKKSVKFSVLLLVPLSCFLIINGYWIINLFLVVGKFSHIDGKNTSLSLSVLLLSNIFVLGSGYTLPRVLNVLNKNYYLLLTDINTIVVNFIFNLILMNLFVFIGISLSTSLVYFINFILLFSFCQKEGLKMLGIMKFPFYFTLCNLLVMGILLFLFKELNFKENIFTYVFKGGISVLALSGIIFFFYKNEIIRFIPGILNRIRSFYKGKGCKN